jgi:hypothetical protein
MTIYQKLEQKDIRGPNPQDDITDLAAVGGRGPRPQTLRVGQYIQSWIWRTINAEDEPVDQVRVQWAKANANAERWEEEKLLVVEEMRRTLASFEWHVQWWSRQVGSRQGTGVATSLVHALDAYARHQAGIWSNRITVFTQAWSPTLSAAKLGNEWFQRYRI